MRSIGASLQADATQIFPAPHALPHALQLFASLVGSASQPLPGTPSQSSIPPRHAPTPQIPFTHAAVPLGGFAQTFPQAPQLFTSLATTTSQPSSALPLQLARPAAQPDRWQTPFQHVLSGPQALPHAPQFAMSLPVSASQPVFASPSQSE